MSSKPTIYISKRCEYCIELLKILRSRPDIRGNFLIVSIDDNPFPNYVKAVPCMVSGDDLYTATDIFTMLEESNDGGGGGGGGGGSGGGGGECSIGQGGGEKQCDVNGYCKDGSCLNYSSLDGDTNHSLDTYYSTINSNNEDPSRNSNDDYKNQKRNSFDSEYEQMMQARSEVNGQPQRQNINFSR